jgi:hypothetical protein
MKRILLAVLLLALAVPAANAFYRVFAGDLPAADAPNRHLTLVLSDDGNATLRTDYAGRGAVIDRGSWSRRAGRIVLPPDHSAPIVWIVRPGSLQPDR